MDPFSILSIAGNVIQFLQFTAGILNSTKKIYYAASGASADSEHLEDVYSNLSRFNERLISWAKKRATEDHGQSYFESAKDLEQIAEACKNDCQKLLDLVTKLKTKTGTRMKWWNSFSKAIREVWVEGEIDKLKARINENRQVATSRLCAVSR